MNDDKTLLMHNNPKNDPFRKWRQTLRSVTSFATNHLGKQNEAINIEKLLLDQSNTITNLFDNIIRRNEIKYH